MALSCPNDARRVATTGVVPDRLFHYTCEDHGLPGIESTGRLKPRPYQNSVAKMLRLPMPPFQVKLLWLTDIIDPGDGHSVGLQAVRSTCDRLAARFIVRAADAMPWPEWADRRGIAPDNRWRWALELDRDPNRWFVLERQVMGSDFERDRLWNPSASRRP